MTLNTLLFVDIIRKKEKCNKSMCWSSTHLLNKLFKRCDYKMLAFYCSNTYWIIIVGVCVRERELTQTCVKRTVINTQIFNTSPTGTRWCGYADCGILFKLAEFIPEIKWTKLPLSHSTAFVWVINHYSNTVHVQTSQVLPFAQRSRDRK